MTVAVPVKDRRAQMLRCLEALLAQDHPSYQILVLDNESTDGTAEAIRERAETAQVPVRVEVHPGSTAERRNLAARLVDSEFLAFTDSDCIPDRGWLRAATAALRANPRLGVVQGRTLPETEPVKGWPATIRVERLTGLYEGCNLVFRREPFAESDGFDEVAGHFWEDTAAGFAVKRLGWEAAYVPEALVRHDVTYPGYWWHVRRMQANANLAPVLERYPEIRREVLFWRVFLQHRDARFVGLVAGLALSRRSPWALLLTLPYAAMLGRGEITLKRCAQALIYDASRVTGLLRGGLRNGRIVL